MLAVRPVSPVGTLRPFLGYRAKTTRKTAKFVKVSGVQLSDDFEAGRFDVIKTGDFLVATADVGAGVALAQRTHLRAYKIKAAKGSPKHVKRLAIPVRDEIGTLRIVDTVKPELLCADRRRSGRCAGTTQPGNRSPILQVLPGRNRQEHGQASEGPPHH
jgi:hypothetical protein